MKKWLSRRFLLPFSSFNYNKCRLLTGDKEANEKHHKSLHTNSLLVFPENSLIILNMSYLNLLKPPESVLGMITLDKESYQKTINIPCFEIRDLQISEILPFLKKYLLKIEHFKPIQHVSQNEVLIYLNPNTLSKWDDLSIENQKSLEDLSVNRGNLIEKEIVLTYENFSAEDIFKAVLPKDEEGFSSFTKTGHIVHVNLREHLLPYKDLIGQVLHDKVHGCRTVINKTNNIENAYRNFEMEVLCGDNDTVARLKENKCIFELDFSTVYWNSRLCTEHERIVNKLKQNDVLFDVFAGIGPFAIPAAKKKCFVFANDLNPESYKWLNRNKKINKIGDSYLKTCNKDGRNFILEDIKEELPKYVNKHNVYVTMNLPALAVEFLENFVGLFKEDELRISNVVTLFVYCFAKGEDCVAIAKRQIIDHIGFDVSDKISEVFSVRTVSSMKEMMRVTIKLDQDILSSKRGCKRKLKDGDLLLAKKFDDGKE